MDLATPRHTTTSMALQLRGMKISEHRIGQPDLILGLKLETKRDATIFANIDLD
jgi:hypothetical protein